LQDGDILFVGKGNRIFAWCYRKTMGNAFASSIFFIIRPKQDLVIPEYLSVMLNLPKNNSYFRQLGAGSSIPSIRKTELAEFKINLVPLDVQEKVVTLHELHQKQVELQNNIIDKQNKMYQNIILKIVNL